MKAPAFMKSLSLALSLGLFLNGFGKSAFAEEVSAPVETNHEHEEAKRD